MALNVLKRLGKLTMYLPSSRTILSTSSKSPFRMGENISNARTITRSLFFLSRNRYTKGDNLGSSSVASPWSNACSCGCDMHTKGDKELAAFLEEEIANESKAQTHEIVSELEDFSCQYDGAEVKLMRKFNHETVTIKTNVNHSVDAEASSMEPSEAKDDDDGSGEMRAKPDFTVEIAKGKKILSFECHFNEPSQEEKDGPYNDAFEITSISMHDGEYLDNTYSVSGEIMDGYLYDLLMNYLEERGVSNDLADKLIVLFTSYEHKLYIDLLQNMKTFVKK